MLKFLMFAYECWVLKTAESVRHLLRFFSFFLPLNCLPSLTFHSSHFLSNPHPLVPSHILFYPLISSISSPSDIVWLMVEQVTSLGTWRLRASSTSWTHSSVKGMWRPSGCLWTLRRARWRASGTQTSTRLRWRDCACCLLCCLCSILSCPLLLLCFFSTSFLLTFSLYFLQHVILLTRVLTVTVAVTLTVTVTVTLAGYRPLSSSSPHSMRLVCSLSWRALL